MLEGYMGALALFSPPSARLSRGKLVYSTMCPSLSSHIQRQPSQVTLDQNEPSSFNLTISGIPSPRQKAKQHTQGESPGSNTRPVTSAWE